MEKEGSWTPNNERQFRHMLRIIEESHVPLGALWVFELPSQNADYNITADNERFYQLSEVAAANARVQGGAATR
jgi:ribosomal protein S4E